MAARQCSPFSVVVNGTDVVFPLRILLVPVGPSPLAFEVRSVTEVTFPADSLIVNFTLPYPTGSRFVGLVSSHCLAVLFSFPAFRIQWFQIISRFLFLITLQVADASGYRGTASTWTVLSSTDTSCFDATKNAVPSFTFALSPTEVAECQDVRIYWTAGDVQG